MHKKLMAVIDKQTMRQFSDWLQFFRDLGIDDLNPPAPETAQEPLGPSAEHARYVSKHESQDRSPEASNLSVPGDRTYSSKLENEVSGLDALDKAQTVELARAAPEQAPVPESPVRAAHPQSFTLFGTLFSEASPAGQIRGETLEAVREDLGDCRRCKLWGGRKHIVFGQGNPRAELVFVGEGPGADEDEQGLPFVGRAGQLLNRMLQLVGIKREDVYICNVVKCRPPGNRTPEADEISACSPFLFRQIQAIHPRLVCCLGGPAAKTVLGIKEGIIRIHGRLLDYGDGKAMATVHPAYVLRNIREEVILREDFDKIRAFLKQKP
jgi:uracil-DNA glycosylase